MNPIPLNCFPNLSIRNLGVGGLQKMGDGTEEAFPIKIRTQLTLIQAYTELMERSGTAQPPDLFDCEKIKNK